MQAFIRQKQGDYAGALNFADKAIAADNTEPWAYEIIGETYHQEGKDAEAIQKLEQLRQNFPVIPSLPNRKHSSITTIFPP